MKSSVKKQREKHKQTFIIDFTQFVFYDIGTYMYLITSSIQITSAIIHITFLVSKCIVKKARLCA